MSLRPWLHSLREWNNRKLGASRRQRCRPSEQRPVLAVECLEERSLPSVLALLIGTDLTLSLDGNDDVAVSANGFGVLQVTSGGAAVQSLPTIAAGTLTSLTVTGSEGNNAIDLTGVVAGVFSPSLVVSVLGGDGADTVSGSDFGDQIAGGDGDDVISGGLGADVIDGGDGADSISGGVGNDSLRGGDGNDTVRGDAGNDTIESGYGADSVDGGDGDDSVKASHGSDTITGGLGNDTLNGEDGTDLITGDAGDDSIFGGADNDTLNGNDGNDTISGQSGHDELNGDDGADLLAGDEGLDLLHGGADNDTLNGGADNDTALGEDGNDSILGGNGFDLLFGDGDNPARLGTGNDTVLGQGGNDSLNGGGGADWLDGGTGNDLVQSGDFDSATGIVITIANAAGVIEGPAGTTANAIFNLTLSSATTQTVTVDFTTRAGSATENGDYDQNAGTVTFAPNTTLATIAVTVRGDNLDEPDENFFVELSNSTVAVIGDTQAEAFIVDDDGWVAQGPAPIRGGQSENVTPNNEVNGAINAIATHPTDPNIAYIGAVNGGVWRTTNLQSVAPTWTPLTDNLASPSMSALEIDPLNPSILFGGIGRRSSFGGAGGDLIGIIRSTDGGDSWTVLPSPLLANRNFRQIAVRGNIVLAGSVGGTGPGLYRSADGGNSWSFISGTGGLGAGSVTDVIRDPSNGNRYYAAVVGQGVYRSDNDGQTWVNVSVNDPGAGGLQAAMTAGNFSNAEFAMGQQGRLFAAVMLAGQTQYIGYTDDRGATWTRMDLPMTREGNNDVGLNPRSRDDGPGGQGALHFSMVVDPTDQNIVYVGGDRQDTPFPNFIGARNFSGRLFRGDTRIAPTGAIPSPQWAHLTHRDDISAIPTGGTANNTSPHADSRDMEFDAAGNLIEGDDGGLYRRTSPRTNTGDWFSIGSNLQVSEFHDVTYDTVSNVIFGGLQDNGTPMQLSAGSTTWQALQTADGGDTAVDTISRPGFSIRYSSFQNLGFFNRRTFDANNNQVAFATPALTVTGNGNALTGRFVTPVEVNAINGNRILIGAQSLYESLNQGDSITEIGVNNAVNASTLVYGGISQGVPNPDLIYAGVGNRVFVRTTGAGNFAATAGAFPGSFVRDVIIDPTDWRIAFAADPNQVWVTTDTGATWTEITGNLANNDLRSLEYIPGPNPTLLAGGNGGVFQMRLSASGVWTELGQNLPELLVYDMDYDVADDVLVIGSLGRGAWAFPNASLGDQVTTPVPGSGGLVDLTAQGDTLFGGDGNDVIVGADGNDLLNGMAGFDSLMGGSGNDVLLGGAANDTLDGGLGDDTVDGQGGNDLVSGGEGADVYAWSGATHGTDTLSSLSGFDRVRINATAVANDFTVSQLNGQIRVTDGSAFVQINSVIQSIEINLGGGDDTLSVTALDRVLSTTLLTINGDGGNDSITAAGADTGIVRLQMFGGLGNDSLTGGNGHDTLDGGDGDDRLDGGAGNDILLGQAGSDRLLGGDGNDFALGGDGSDSISGQAGDDSLRGDAAADTIEGGLGNDTLEGGDGTDTLLAGDGHDSVLGGNDDDLLDGGAGNDTMQGGGGSDTLLGLTGTDQLFGNDGDDSILGGDENDTINGGDGNDTVMGELGNDLIGGSDGNDLLNGGAGNDSLIGGNGNDILLGGAGHDVLLGSDGDDTINGQGGADTVATGEGIDVLNSDLADILDEAFSLPASLLAALT